MIDSCDACDAEATHEMTHGGETAVIACCRCADRFMSWMATTVPADEGREGWRLWREAHTTICPDHRVLFWPTAVSE